MKLVEGSFKALRNIISSSYKLLYQDRQIKLETLMKGARAPAVINVTGTLYLPLLNVTRVYCAEPAIGSCRSPLPGVHEQLRFTHVTTFLTTSSFLKRFWCELRVVFTSLPNECAEPTDLKMVFLPFSNV